MDSLYWKNCVRPFSIFTVTAVQHSSSIISFIFGQKSDKTTVHHQSTTSVLSYLLIQGHFMPTVWYLSCVSTLCLKLSMRIWMQFSFSSSKAAEEAECLVCTSCTYLAQTFFFFFFPPIHSCNHLFVSFASSARSKLLSWKHLSIRIIEAVTGANSVKGF